MRKVRLTESDIHRIVKESVKRILKEEKYWSPEYVALYITYKWVKYTISNLPHAIKDTFQGISRIKDEKTSEGLDSHSFELFVNPEELKSITRYANWFKKKCKSPVDIFVSGNSIIFSSKKAEFESHYE